MPTPPVWLYLINMFQHIKNITQPCLLLTYRFWPQQNFDSAWPEMGAGFGYNMAPPQGREQMQQEYNAEPSTEPATQGIYHEFFGGDMLSTQESLIPPASESEYVLQTPPHNDDTQLHDEGDQYGRGYRHPQPRQQWSPSGPRPRPNRRRQPR